ncbi:MAG: preprotein translocase subunit SecE [Sedimentisphaerales bacterium]|nr:preprotein translocase subunit SecE [Sedimentisphaerales bacterium]
MALEFYKKGQGYYTRLGTAIGAGVLAVLGCYSLYQKLDAITPGDTITPNVKVWLRAGIPAAVFAVLGWLVFKIVNSPRSADFMIATEGEMKKVSWSSKKEVINSTKVVIVTVIILSVLLAVVDFGFAKLFQWIGVLKVMG